MTPKEKAKELVDKYYLIISGTEVSFLSKLIKLPNKETDYELAKQCAILAVNEINDAIDFDILHVQNLENEHRFWDQVESEIIQL